MSLFHWSSHNIDSEQTMDLFSSLSSFIQRMMSDSHWFETHIYLQQIQIQMVERKIFRSGILSETLFNNTFSMYWLLIRLLDAQLFR